MQQENIETKAFQTYQNNLYYFQNNHPEVFQKVSALESAINNGHYQQRYSLEYKDDGEYFDVLELSTNKYLYGSSSIQHAELAAQSIDFKKKGNLFETFYNVYIDDKDVPSYEKAPIPDTPYAASAKIINYANKYAQDPDAEMKKLYKFIFFGTGLGLHLQTIHQKLQSHVYFILENDLELFYLSLFVTDYKSLSNEGAQLIFSVFEEEDEFKKSVEFFLHEQFIYNQYLKFFHILSHDEKVIKEFQKVILGQPYLVFNYSALTNSLLRSLEHIKNEYAILNISKKFDEEIFTTKPLLVLGAGPSLHKNLSWIKEHQDKFIIVTVTAMLTLLEKEGIKPSIITHVHGFSDALPHVQNVKDMQFFDESIAMFSTFTMPEFVAYFKKENVFLFQGTSQFKKDFEGLASSNIGALTYGLLLKLGAQNLYLVGLDFAIDEETGASHSGSHAYTRTYNKDKTQYDTEDDISYRDSVVMTKGNLQEKVKTTILLNSFKDQCNLFTQVFKSDKVTVRNLSNGAYIEESIPTSIDSIDTTTMESLNKTTVFKKLHKNYQKNSQNYLTEDEIQTIKNKLEYIKKIESILDEYAKKKYSNMDNFHYNLLGTFISILGEDFDETAKDMNEVLSMYLQYVAGFIFDIINTKNLQNEKHHIKALNRIVISETKKIVLYFKDYLANYLEEIEEKIKEKTS